MGQFSIPPWVLPDFLLGALAAREPLPVPAELGVEGRRVVGAVGGGEETRADPADPADPAM